LGKTRQAFYDHRGRADQQALDDGLIVDTVRCQRQKTPGIGGRKLFHLLEEQWQKHGIQLGRDQFFDLLRQHDLLIRRRKKYAITTNSKHWLKKHPNLMGNLVIKEAEQGWVTDITYVSVADKFGYLMLLTDMYSHKIVGHAFSPSLSASFCVQALQQALNNRQFPDRPLLHHSDRGIQYCSKAYVDVLIHHGCQISMTQNGDPYENAMAERINGILKQEWKLDQTFADFEQAKTAVEHAIYHYNHSRPHASCDYLTPIQAHQQTGPLLKRWKNKSKNKKPNTVFNIIDLPRWFGFTFVKPPQDLFSSCKAIQGLSLNL